MRFNGLDLNLLVAFQVLLEERNVTRAARRLNVSQPAMSAALNRLRDYFQDDILAVQGKHMLPTARAQSLAGPISEFLAGLEGLLRRSANFDPATTQRTFRLVASDYITAAVIGPLSIRLATIAPQVRLEMMLPSEEAAQLVVEGQADLVVTPEEFADPAQPMELLCEERQVVVGWKGNPALRDALSAADFERLGHVAVFLDSNAVPSFADRHLERMGSRRHIAVTCGCFTLVPWLICGTARIAVMHERLALQIAARFPCVVRPLPFDFPVMREMVQYHKAREADAGLRWLRQLLKSEAETPLV
ncbi:MAG TPA: LysR family transcriptional regulator [Steroidobacteraceae bacterium]|nr:LysR family transcriptional regulator [Steroidobacteraceae bacterium]